MSAEDALKYGLIDEIVQPDDEKLKSLLLPPPGKCVCSLRVCSNACHVYVYVCLF